MAARGERLRIGESEVDVPERDDIKVEEIQPTDPRETPPPPPKPRVPVAVPDDVVLEEDEIDFGAELERGNQVDEVPPPVETVERDPEPEPARNAAGQAGPREDEPRDSIQAEIARVRPASALIRLQVRYNLTVGMLPAFEEHEGVRAPCWMPCTSPEAAYTIDPPPMGSPRPDLPSGITRRVSPRTNMPVDLL